MADNPLIRQNPLLSGNSVPGRFGFLSGGRGGSLASALGQEQADLLRTARSVSTLGQQAQILGQKDVTGKGPLGFLTGALDYLGRPQSALLGFLTGLTGNTGAGEPTGALQRAAGALFQGEDYRGGEVIDRLVSPARKDASILEKILRTGAGFGIDVATDPLTYLTRGRGGTLRGAAAGAAAEAEVATSATKALRPLLEAEVKAPTIAGIGTSTEAAREATQGRIGALLGKPTTGAEAPVTSILKPVKGPVESIATTKRLTTPVVEAAGVAPVLSTIEEVNPLIKTIAEAAGSGQILRGARGMRQGISEALGATGRFTPEEVAKYTSEIVGGVRGELRGGIGVRVPFIGRDAAGNIVPAGKATTRRLINLTDGSGKLTDAAGLRGVADSFRTYYNDYRSSDMFRNLQDKLGGEFGAAYADFIKTAHTGQGAMDYKTLTKMLADDRARKAATYTMDKLSQDILLATTKMVDDATDKEAAMAAAERFGQMRDNMQLPANATADERIGFNIAKTLRDHTQDMFNIELRNAEARAGIAVGDQVPKIENYGARPITREYAQWIALRGERTKQYMSTSHRVIKESTDALGRTSSLSADELNRKMVEDGLVPAGIKVFETQPWKVAAQQMASYSQYINKMNLIADLKATGKLVEAAESKIKLPNAFGIVERGTDYKSTLTTVAERLSAAMSEAVAAGDTARIEKISDALDKVATDKVVINSLLANIDGMDPNSQRIVNNLIATIRGTIAKVGDAGIKLSPIEEKALLSRKGLITEKLTKPEVEDLVSRGLLPLEGREGVKIPKGLSNMYADETVRSVIDKYFKVETGALNTKPFFTDVYQPFYTLFKMYATVGRPGGYHLRNLQGGWWNNYLGDVSAADHNLSAKINYEAFQSDKLARSAVEALQTGKASGLTGDELKLAQTIVDLAKNKGISAPDNHIGDLGNYILMKKLEKIRVGEHSMADVLTSARQNGIMSQGNKRLESLRNDARLSGNELTDSLLDPNNINVFRGKSKDELTRFEDAINKAANLNYLKFSGNMADASENYIRLAAFISGARRYGLNDGGTAASALTKALQFDYADLSDFERKVLKNVVPFYTWTRRNLPLQFNALLNDPGKFNKLNFFKEEAQGQFGAQGDSGEMLDVIPEWMREKMGFVTNIDFNGNPILAGIESPAMDLNRYLTFGDPRKGADQVWRQTVSSANPLAKALVESVSNVDTFTGGKFNPNGTEFPFAIPGLTFKGSQGENRIDAKSYNIVKDLIPPIGTFMRLLPAGNSDRLLTNYLSTFGGLPVSTLSPDQAKAELMNREDALRQQVIRGFNQIGVDREWVTNLIDEGYTIDAIRNLIAQGYGKITPAP